MQTELLRYFLHKSPCLAKHLLSILTLAQQNRSYYSDRACVLYVMGGRNCDRFSWHNSMLDHTAANLGRTLIAAATVNECIT